VIPRNCVEISTDNFLVEPHFQHHSCMLFISTPSFCFMPAPLPLLVAFAKFRKALISFVMSVSVSIRMEQLGCHWGVFREIWYLSIFRKSVQKIQVSLKSDNNNGYFHEDLSTFISLKPFKVYWLCDAPTGLTFNNCKLCPYCIYVFCIYPRTNSDLCHWQHKLIGFYNRGEKCLLRGTNWVFK